MLVLAYHIPGFLHGKRGKEPYYTPRRERGDTSSSKLGLRKLDEMEWNYPREDFVTRYRPGTAP